VLNAPDLMECILRTYDTCVANGKKKVLTAELLGLFRENDFE